MSTLIGRVRILSALMDVLFQIQDWHVQGLPRDAHSVQSALMLLHSDKAPFLIDPQGQALV